MADLNSLFSGAKSIVSTVSQTAGSITGFVNQAQSGGIVSAFKSLTLPKGGVPGNKTANATAQFSAGAQRDWRVKLSLPTGSFATSELLYPLTVTNGLVFPYTPQITLSHQASYQSTAPVHNNYPFLSYENSKVENITITGDFFCEDATEAQYWVAAVHYLRSVTKMKFGADADAGAPPPVVKLNGYGDYVFKNVPVVVTNFQMDLPKDVDYIATGLGRTQARDKAAMTGNAGANAGQGVAWAPVKSTFTVTLQPLYSREQQRNFSLDKFVKGDYVLGSGKGTTGFI